MASHTRYDKMPVRADRETVFVKETGNCKSQFKVHVRNLVNGLLNSHGGVVYFGVTNEGIMTGLRISRKEEDDFRLAVDHTIGRFLPLVSADLYRLTFITLRGRGHHDDVSHKIIELKVSVGKVGEIYEDGEGKVVIIDKGLVIGPLHPQELRELVLLKYKEAMEGAEEVAKFATPHLAKEKAAARNKVATLKSTVVSASTLPTLRENHHHHEESELNRKRAI